jgi:hypothetical protein
MLSIAQKRGCNRGRRSGFLVTKFAACGHFQDANSSLYFFCRPRGGICWIVWILENAWPWHQKHIRWICVCPKLHLQKSTLLSAFRLPPRWFSPLGTGSVSQCQLCNCIWVCLKMNQNMSNSTWQSSFFWKTAANSVSSPAAWLEFLAFPLAENARTLMENCLSGQRILVGTVQGTDSENCLKPLRLAVIRSHP